MTARATVPVPAPQEAEGQSAAQQEQIRPAKWHEQMPYALKDISVDAPAPPPSVAADAITDRSARKQPSEVTVTPRPYAEHDEDDGRPYRLDGHDERPCPECSQRLAAEILVCPSCGFNLQTGQKHARTYEVVERTWTAGWSFETRRKLFFIGQLLAWPMSLLTGFEAESFSVFLWPLLFFSAASAFVLGTFDRVDLSRNKRGKVLLKYTWRFFFFPHATVTVRLGDYEGVVSGKWREADFWDWMILLFLLSFGPISAFLIIFIFPLAIVPAVAWWYFFIHRDTFFVALARDHGHPDLYLYRGWNEALMRDLYKTVEDVAFPGTGTAKR
jgi:hypothetical protein